MSLAKPRATPEHHPTTQIEARSPSRFRRARLRATTIDDIAAAVGVGRRTLFRYFPSKNDIVWGDFDWVIERLRTHLAGGAATTAADGALRARRDRLQQLPAGAAAGAAASA